jgi:hypothetical protein
VTGSRSVTITPVRTPGTTTCAVGSSIRAERGTASAPVHLRQRTAWARDASITLRVYAAPDWLPDAARRRCVDQLDDGPDNINRGATERQPEALTVNERNQLSRF